jgi:hypothetical protein
MDLKVEQALSTLTHVLIKCSSSLGQLCSPVIYIPEKKKELVAHPALGLY